MTGRITSDRGRALIIQFEGSHTVAYRCPRGIWTCGVGSTGPDVVASTVWTEREVSERFQADLRRFEIAVNKRVTVPVTQNQFDALVALVFNIGIESFKASTLLRLLNDGKFREAGEQFGRWIHAGSAVLPGLIRRRKAEAELFLARDGKSEA